MFRKTLAFAAVILAAIFSDMAAASAQDRDAQIARYAERYDLLVSKLGPAGVGIETLLDNWAALDSTDVRMLAARFNYYFTKSQYTEVVAKNQKRYLGASPVLTLKDSTGNDVSYFQEIFYNDSLYAMSVRYLDKAIRLRPERLDLRFLKATALTAYEKESPDMALSYLQKLVYENESGMVRWEYPGADLTGSFFADSIQEYCYTFFNIGTPGSYAAFLTLSEKMLSYYPKSTVFLANVGSYYLVAGNDTKTALKYYNKVLKIKPDDYTAIKNCVLIARRMKDTRLEKKYLPMMAKYGSESEKLAAKTRLEAL